MSPTLLTRQLRHPDQQASLELGLLSELNLRGKGLWGMGTIWAQPNRLESSHAAHLGFLGSPVSTWRAISPTPAKCCSTLSTSQASRSALRSAALRIVEVNSDNPGLAVPPHAPWTGKLNMILPHAPTHRLLTAGAVLYLNFPRFLREFFPASVRDKLFLL